MSDPEPLSDAWFGEDRMDDLADRITNYAEYPGEYDCIDTSRPRKLLREEAAAALEWAAERHLDAGVHASPQHLLRAKAREIREGE